MRVSQRSGLIALAISLLTALTAYSQSPVSVGSGSYASYVPLTKSKTSGHEGCQAYQMEHRTLSLPDSLLARLGTPNGSQQGTLALPTNDWWTYALVHEWTGKIWTYPGWVEATANGIDVGYPDHWESTGCEVKWETPLHIDLKATRCVVDNWSDFMMSFIVYTAQGWVRVTCMHGSPIVWLETNGMTLTVTNPDATKYAVFEQANQLSVALLTDGLDKATVAPYAFRIPRKTTMIYAYDANSSTLSTTFHVDKSVLMGLLPHHYYNIAPADRFINNNVPYLDLGNTYMTPRGTMHMFAGNDFTCVYPVHSFLPFFPAPLEWKEDFSRTRMVELNADYAKRGSFGGDTYWGGKGLTQMAHYMTFALQMNDTANFRMAKQRLKNVLIDWYTYTPGEERYYFARYPRWGALIGMDPSYDSETFNDHHFHYGYFVYASAILCFLDDDFRTQYGSMVREVARDYANWQRSTDEPWFRTFDPYCGHSFAGGLGNAGNGNGQESSSEAIQGWGGLWMLGAALQDQEMLEAGIMGYTLETRATAEYWFDRQRRNIDYTKYKHPYCCNLTMQGVGWWTWFSGDPVWMHSIQWLPISPILTNHFCEDLDFTRWDYSEMYKAKEIGNYEAPEKGLGDESGLGNVCLSYLSLFDADSAARVWKRMDAMGKALAKNPDTGGITYWLTHSHKALGEKRFDIFANHPLACAYTDTISGRITYAVYNVGSSPLNVHFFGEVDTTVTVPHGLTLISGNKSKTVTTIEDEHVDNPQDPLAWDLPYSNLALHKPVTASSEENAGCLAQSLTDGNVKTRWGSAHHDNEYVIVDLQQQCYIDHLILRWETAYATEYELALSDDNTTWRTVILSSSGGVETINLQSQIKNLTSCRARYIRLTGLKRATTYGTSLYELEAYGRPLTGDPDKVFVIALSASDTVLYQGQSSILTTTSYGYNGKVLATQNETLSFPDYGLFTVERTVEDVSASLTFVVLETEQTDSIIVSPDEVTMPIGDKQKFSVSTINQFGYPVSTCDYTFRATQIGDTLVPFECAGLTTNALVHVLPYSAVNLALNKPATCSGTENEAVNGAGKAVDGDLDTRWSSRFQDNEWLEVDLAQCYVLDSVRIYWENAYATAYDLLLSSDAVSYETVYSTTAGKGGNVTIPVSGSGRYVRLLCEARNTGYGASVWEFQVFGSGRCDPDDDDEETITHQPLTANPLTPYKFIKNGQIFISRNGVLYTIDGRVLLRP